MKCHEHVTMKCHDDVDVHQHYVPAREGAEVAREGRGGVSWGWMSWGMYAVAVVGL